VRSASVALPAAAAPSVTGAKYRWPLAGYACGAACCNSARTPELTLRNRSTRTIQEGHAIELNDSLLLAPTVPAAMAIVPGASNASAPPEFKCEPASKVMRRRTLPLRATTGNSNRTHPAIRLGSALPPLS